MCLDYGFIVKDAPAHAEAGNESERSRLYGILHTKDCGRESLAYSTVTLFARLRG
jgi:hypothetical protein